MTATTEEGMQKPKNSGVHIELKALMIPISLGLMALLRFVFEVPLWALGLMCGWIPLYYLGYPWLLRRKWYAFEKEFAKRFQKGEYKQELLDTAALWRDRVGSSRSMR